MNPLESEFTMQGQLFVETFQDRELLIYLPPAYNARRESFPVVYIHDRGDIFDPDKNSSIATIEQKIADGQLQDLILVGIPPRLRRDDEYTPWPAPTLVDWFDDFGGKGPEYLAWLVNELKPFIESTYRADGRPENTGIMGKSLGGLISIYASYLYPAVFGKIGCISGSFWYEGFVEFMQSQTILNLDRRIYMDVGTIEGMTKQTRQREMVPRTHAAYATLVKNGFTPDRLKFIVEEGADHAHPYFFKRFPGALEWLFPGEKGL